MFKIEEEEKKKKKTESRIKLNRYDTIKFNWNLLHWLINKTRACNANATLKFFVNFQVF